MGSRPLRGTVRRRLVAAIVAATVLLSACTGGATNAGGASTPQTGPRSPAAGTLPDLIGMRREPASAQLDALGLVYYIHPLGGATDDVVVRQRPAPGTPLPEIRRAFLFVRCLPAPCPYPGEGMEIFDPCSCSTRPAPAD